MVILFTLPFLEIPFNSTQLSTHTYLSLDLSLDPTLMRFLQSSWSSGVSLYLPLSLLSFLINHSLAIFLGKCLCLFYCLFALGFIPGLSSSQLHIAGNHIFQSLLPSGFWVGVANGRHSARLQGRRRGEARVFLILSLLSLVLRTAAEYLLWPQVLPGSLL